MNESSRQLAIIGPTASGKSELAIEIAEKIDGIILSLDSLALYREIDIASAKPSPEERGTIPHFGIDIRSPDEAFDVTLFADLYRETLALAEEKRKRLIIVGGTSFYLKILMDGISILPNIDKATAAKVRKAMEEREEAYRMLSALDPVYMEKIPAGDSYRIEKALGLFYLTGKAPSDYFRAHPPQPLIRNRLPIYRIVVEKSLLRERIVSRTAGMLHAGLIDEVASLEKRYTRLPGPMKAIGIRETLDFLDGQYDRGVLAEKIVTHTARLAKRQNTFNTSQFDDHPALDREKLRKKILGDYGI